MTAAVVYDCYSLSVTIAEKPESQPLNFIG